MPEPGRPTDYKQEFNEQAEKLCKLGAIDKDLADFFEVTEQTINNWKSAHPDFFESIKKGKQIADMEVADKLYKRATGYEHTATKFFQYEGRIIAEDYIEHYPPDTTAAIFWLKNRKPEKWRDKQEVEHSGSNFNISLNLDNATDDTKLQPPADSKPLP